MARKRSADEVEAPIRLRREGSKKAKLSPIEDAQSNSSAPSTRSVSEDYALHSSPVISQHTRQSSVSSIVTASSVESISSVPSSDEDSDLDTEDDTEILTVRGTEKPRIGYMGAAEAPVDLKARLASFLPQMAEANHELERDMAGQSMEVVEDGEAHIEMNLGLGVLEEKDDDDSSSDKSSDTASETSDEGAGPASSGGVRREREHDDLGVMHKLLGQKRTRQKAGIEAVD